MSVKIVNRSAGISGKFYLPSIIKGLLITTKHFFANFFFSSKIVTISYPEETRPIAPRWRGRHRLTRHENGFIKCVACYMCETICPAKCIHIEAAESVYDKSVEKYPRVFDIDELRCVFCGLCVEACPEDAIRMDSGIISLTYSKRNQFDFTRDLLLDDSADSDTTKYTQIPLPSSEASALPKSKGVSTNTANLKN